MLLCVLRLALLLWTGGSRSGWQLSHRGNTPLGRILGCLPAQLRETPAFQRLLMIDLQIVRATKTLRGFA
jgi:hypothetical protein